MNIKCSAILFPVLLFIQVLRVQASDIDIIMRPASPYQFGSKDFWNLDIMVLKTGQSPVIIQAHLKGRDQSEMVKAVSMPLNIQQGLNSYNGLNVQTRSIQYYNKAVEDVDRTSRSFPPDQYQLVIEVLDAQTQAVLASASEQVMVEFLTPTMLIYPDNDQTIPEQNPFLTWLPPSPSKPGEILYTLKVVELLKGQTAADAIVRNRPLIQIGDISQTFYQYPYNAPRLESGKSYAWQVETQMNHPGEGKQNHYTLAKSDVWIFKLGTETIDIKKIPRNHSYVDIKECNPGTLFWMFDTLKIKYVERSFSGKLSYQVYDMNGKPVYEGKDLLTIKPGDNRFDIILGKIPKVKHLQTYQIDIQDATGKHWIMKFSYINSDFIKE